MTVTLSYKGIGKGVAIDGVELINYYGNDFNPTNPTVPQWTTSFVVSGGTSSFNLSGFQPGHEVGCGVFNLKNNGSSNVNFILYGDFQRNSGGSWTTSRYFSWSASIAPNQEYAGWMYFGVDDDEIWDGYTSYRIRWRGSAGSDIIGPEYSNFTVSNLNIDSNLYNPGCLRLDGTHLCYTDSTGFESGYNGYGYKHKIAYDSSVWEYVGRQYAGSIWMEDSGATAMQRIYYVTENGYKTRTYGCQQWYGGNVNVGSGCRGSIRVPTGDMEDGYGHLCYVTATGQKLRVLNGPPEGYV